MRVQACFWSALVLLAGCATVAPRPETAPFAPARHGDFDHDTLALTWQPGFCSTSEGCEADQPHAPLIGLHGLWASEPHALEGQGVPVQEWWRKGCPLLEDAPDAAPVLEPPVAEKLSAVVPHTAQPLVPHEWNKHAACFGYAATPFFAKALALRDRFAQSAPGLWLVAHQGRVVSHEAMIASFEASTFGSVGARPVERALQTQCRYDRKGRVVLTQIWFTLSPKHLDDFPAAASYVSSPEAQDNCPAQFLIPHW
ncbi:ribonuclease T2 family protein [Acidomonas methanolica]|uniref:Ribonuclease I n=1 Tax=Acidomonas methanolica NBRC 104435 TaxID=1231351 RepID=A0A023D3K5_ACIMT|nr:hypothetical protein [Acidomonas methanolica]MBU2653571.1 ribonuclease I [Acidomonas methanolica]TCS31522.1 ribonuclease I [Acidomonas methanolica]GAJ28733.1 ribonuclease I [Acidomonas methanolica NBRC 104435]GBQ47635.1 ribonuclease I [Acidomonas methanolica]GEK97941.1 ribonuclease [Acidomonas methanolica NBRC 104435]